MFKEPYSVDNYINFLFYSIDLNTIFPKSEISTIYKNKYKRLSETLPDNNTHSINTAYLIIDNIITVLKNYYSDYLSNDRIMLFKKMYNSLNYDRLIFKSNLSLSFIELYTDNEDLWDDIVKNIYCFLSNEYRNYIHDDSDGSYRILTISVPIIEYSYTKNIPDISDNNQMISLSFYDMIESIPIVDDNIKNIFTSELKYLINDNSINKDKLFTELLNDCINLDIYDIPIDKIRSMCIEIISYMNNDNLHLITHLLFKIMTKIFCGNSLSDTDFENLLIKKLTTIMAIDIAVYNKSIQIDINNLKLLLLAYNYCIITIQDRIDKLSNDLNGKKISMYMYKSQLFKSRNKIQERIDKLCQI